MKATDLMIGDWVLYGQRFAIIKELYNGYVTILCSINGQNEYVEETYDNIEPITITPEILEKNGFTAQRPENHIEIVYYLQDISKAIADEMYALWPETYGFYLVIRRESKDMIRIGIKYVHELQHALKLCGIKKEIEL